MNPYVLGTDPYTNNNAHSGVEDQVALIIADDPTVITRTRESTPDKFRGNKVVTTVGPYTVRIEPFRQIRGEVVSDQEGDLALSNFTLLALDLPEGTLANLDEIQAIVPGMTKPVKYIVASVDVDGRITEAALQKRQ